MGVPAVGLLALTIVAGPLPVQDNGAAGSQEALAATITKPAPTFKIAEDRPGRPVIALSIHRFYATDAVLERLSAFPDLEELAFLEDTSVVRTGIHPVWRVSDEGVGHLRRLKHLRSLSLPTSLLTDAGMAYLGEMTQLEELAIGNGNGRVVPREPANGTLDESIVANVTDAGLKRLQALRELRSLTLFGTRITDDGLESLKQFIHLRKHNIRLLKGGVTERGLAHLKNVPSLRDLAIEDSVSAPRTQTIDSSLAPLTTLRGLESLTIFSLRVTDAGMVHVGRMAKLRNLDLDHWIATMPLTDGGLEQLTELSELRRLRLGIRRVSDRGLAALSKLSKLEVFEITGLTHLNITDSGLLQLRTLTALKELRIPQDEHNDEFEVTPAGIEALRKQLPDLKVIR